MGASRPPGDQVSKAPHQRSCSEDNFQRKLDVAVVVELIAAVATLLSLGEGGIRSAWLCATGRTGVVHADVGTALAEAEDVKVLVIGKIKELAPELHINPFRKLEVFVNSKVQVPVTRSDKRVSGYHVRRE